MTLSEVPHPGHGCGRGRPAVPYSHTLVQKPQLSQSPPWALSQNSGGASDGLRWAMCPFLNQSRGPGGWSIWTHLGLMLTLGGGGLWVSGPSSARQSTLSGPSPTHASHLRLHASTLMRVLSPQPGPCMITASRHKESHLLPAGSLVPTQ